MLKEGGWTLVRQKLYYIYKREIITRTGDRRGRPSLGKCALLV